MRTHSVHCATGVQLVTIIHQTYHSGQFQAIIPNSTKPQIPRRTRLANEPNWRMNQHAYPDVKILNINDREHVANMHTEQPMNHFRSNEAIHQNPQIPNMNPNFSFFTNHAFFAIKGVKTCVQHPYKKPITYFTSKHPHL